MVAALDSGAVEAEAAAPDNRVVGAETVPDSMVVEVDLAVAVADTGVGAPDTGAIAAGTVYAGSGGGPNRLPHCYHRTSRAFHDPYHGVDYHEDLLLRCSCRPTFRRHRKLYLPQTDASPVPNADLPAEHQEAGPLEVHKRAHGLPHKQVQLHQS